MMPPIAIVLDKDVHFRLGENSILPFWIQNISGAEISEVALRVHPVGEGLDIRIRPIDKFADGRVFSVSAQIFAHRPGRYALDVGADVTSIDGVHSAWRCPHNVLITVSAPDANHEVHMTFEGPAVLKGYAPPGKYLFNQEAVVQFPADLRQGLSVGPGAQLNDEIIPVERRLGLILEILDPPGIKGGIDLSELAKHWLGKGKKKMAGFGLQLPNCKKKEHGDAACARAEEDRLRINMGSFSGGHVTLISQGVSGEFYQLLPHTHHGEQELAEGGKERVFPDHMLTNFSNASDTAPKNALDVGELTFMTTGKERFLALVCRTPLVEAREIFRGDGLTPRTLETAEVLEILRRAHQRKDVEWGYAEVEVI